MKKLIRLAWPLLAVILLLTPISASARLPGGTTRPTVHTVPDVTVACGVSMVPYSLYSMSISQNETLTLTFNSTGAGLITFVANNFQDSLWARTDGNCGSCTLTIPNISPGPLGTLQLSATAAADACPSGGLVVSNFVLTVSPVSPVH